MSLDDAQAAGRRRTNRLIVIGALVFLGGLWLVASVQQSRARQAPAASSPRITAGVRLGSAAVEVTNQDAFAWTGVVVRLNPGLSGRYDCTVGRLAPGETIVVRLADCVTPDGLRFDAQRRRPTALAIKTTQGDRYFQP